MCVLQIVYIKYHFWIEKKSHILCQNEEFLIFPLAEERFRILAEYGSRRLKLPEKG